MSFDLVANILTTLFLASIYACAIYYLVKMTRAALTAPLDERAAREREINREIQCAPSEDPSLSSEEEHAEIPSSH